MSIGQWLEMLDAGADDYQLVRRLLEELGITDHLTQASLTIHSLLTAIRLWERNQE